MRPTVHEASICPSCGMLHLGGRRCPWCGWEPGAATVPSEERLIWAAIHIGIAIGAALAVALIPWLAGVLP